MAWRIRFVRCRAPTHPYLYKCYVFLKSSYIYTGSMYESSGNRSMAVSFRRTRRSWAPSLTRQLNDHEFTSSSSWRYTKLKRRVFWFTKRTEKTRLSSPSWPPWILHDTTVRCHRSVQPTSQNKTKQQKNRVLLKMNASSRTKCEYSPEKPTGRERACCRECPSRCICRESILSTWITNWYLWLSVPRPFCSVPKGMEITSEKEGRLNEQPCG